MIRVLYLTLDPLRDGAPSADRKAWEAEAALDVRRSLALPTGEPHPGFGRREVCVEVRWRTDAGVIANIGAARPIVRALVAGGAFASKHQVRHLIALAVKGRWRPKLEVRVCLA